MITRIIYEVQPVEEFVEVILSLTELYTEDDFKDPDFTSSTGNTTGETGNLGVTYMPTNGSLGKADAENPNSIHVNP